MGYVNLLSTIIYYTSLNFGRIAFKFVILKNIFSAKLFCYSLFPF